MELGRAVRRRRKVDAHPTVDIASARLEIDHQRVARRIVEGARARQLAAGFGERDRRRVELGRRPGIVATAVTGGAGRGRGQRGGEEKEEWKEAPEDDRRA
ncbi:MAG: hypothetical protein ACT4PI_04715 [Actinomycetota bacterium]